MRKNRITKVMGTVSATLAITISAFAAISGGVFSERAQPKAGGVLAFNEIKPVVGGLYLPFTMATYNPALCGLNRVSVSKYVGPDSKESDTKVLVLNFFASYCESCKKEMDDIISLYERHNKNGFMAMSVGIDAEKEGIDWVTNYVEQKRIKYPVIRDEKNILMKRYGVENVPVTFVINKAGKVIGHFTEYNEETHKKLEKLIYDELGLAAEKKTGT
ncbi:MAG: hypothetical protein Kow0090_11130 [Myxococcota bacterium]